MGAVALLFYPLFMSFFFFGQASQRVAWIRANTTHKDFHLSEQVNAL